MQQEKHRGTVRFFEGGLESLQRTGFTDAAMPSEELALGVTLLDESGNRIEGVVGHVRVSLSIE